MLFIWHRDNQTTAGFEIYEGNRKMAAYNHKLGEITLTGGMEGEAGMYHCSISQGSLYQALIHAIR